MSFKKWSAAQTASTKDESEGKPAEMAKDPPVVDQPPVGPEKTPAEVAPAPKS